MSRILTEKEIQNIIFVENECQKTNEVFSGERFYIVSYDPPRDEVIVLASSRDEAEDVCREIFFDPNRFSCDYISCQEIKDKKLYFMIEGYDEDIREKIQKVINEVERDSPGQTYLNLGIEIASKRG